MPQTRMGQKVHPEILLLQIQLMECGYDNKLLALSPLFNQCLASKVSRENI